MLKHVRAELIIKDQLSITVLQDSLKVVKYMFFNLIAFVFVVVVVVLGICINFIRHGT